MEFIKIISQLKCNVFFKFEIERYKFIVFDFTQSSVQV